MFMLFAPREDGFVTLEIACYAHARRKFKEASKAAGAKHSAGLHIYDLLKWINKLSWLDGWPARAPVNASTCASRRLTHDSGTA
ncbi:MAG: hypothetical protein RL095_2045 [Verrucomicrobiota bacterium]|jgi:hypothetical protein